MTEQDNLLYKANITFYINLFLYAGLIISLLIETWWINPPDASLPIISMVQLFPLLIPFPGLIRKGTRAAAWLCFILCFYFISGVLDAWFMPHLIHGWLITAFSFTLFITAMMFIRWQGKAMNMAIETRI